MVCVLTVRGRKPRNISEVGNHLEMLQKDNDIAPGLIGDLPYEIKLQGHVCLG